jgi:hypothetical protein
MTQVEAARAALSMIEGGKPATQLQADLEAARRARNGDTAGRLHIVTARELCALPDPPDSDELLGPLVVRGARQVIGGHTGEGKTTLAIALIGAIALERDFLGFTGRGGRALVIDAEQGLKTVKRRLAEAGLEDTDRIDYLRTPDGLSLDRDAAQIAEVERVLATGRYASVLADPLYKLHSGDSNDERQAVDLMRRFDAWREQYRFALTMPVHCRKPPVGAKFSMHEFFGSSAYLRGAEVVLGLQRLSDGYGRLHFFKDRDGDLPVGDSWGLFFSREEGFRRDPDDGKPKLSATERIAELLREQPEITKQQIQELTGYAERTVRDALGDLGATKRRPGPTAQELWTLADEEVTP